MSEISSEPRFHGSVTPQRSHTMSRIHGKDTHIETILRKELWKRGIRYRKNYKALPGRPDIAITKYKIAIFCDSEFFHGKDWDTLKLKLSKGNNPDYWIPKIMRNMQRDRENDQVLRSWGWTIIHFWGKQIQKDPAACVEQIQEMIFLNTIDSCTAEVLSLDSE